MLLEQLNQHVKNYLVNDKTNSAIMLAGPWGTGKSYYIKNKLQPYLLQEGHDCIIVSLYGINSLSELIKSIFWEFQIAKMKKRWCKEPSNDASTKKKGRLFLKCERVLKKGKSLGFLAWGFGKTFLKGLTKIKDVDVSISEKDLERFYKSIDATGDLIILEDLERCAINVIELLGFVNNLVEQDGAKVLLVANEGEISNQEEYGPKKEKTVGDTLIFVPNEAETIENIVELFFDNDVKQNLLQTERIKEITDVIGEMKSSNFRSVIFACQKTNDMIRMANKSLDSSFVAYLLCSNIAFSCRLRAGEQCAWESDITSPSKLGTPRYPLYKVCFDYIKDLNFCAESLQVAEQAYLERVKLENDKNEFNDSFETLRQFYRETERKVSNALLKIRSLLEKNAVLHDQYGELANYLFAIEECVANISDIDNCRQKMLENLQGTGTNDKKEMSILIHSGIELDTKEQLCRFEKFKKEMIEAMAQVSDARLNFSVLTAQDFLDFVQTNYQEGRALSCFVKTISIHEFLEWIKKCNAAELEMVRYAFRHVYSLSKAKEYLVEDIGNLEVIKNNLSEIKENFEGFDRIQKKQISWFISNLKSFIQDLS